MVCARRVIRPSCEALALFWVITSIVSPTAPAAAALSASSVGSGKSSRKHVVVVGGGVGGLAISARIAAAATASASSASSADGSSSCRVTLLEKNPQSMLGGRCGSFDVAVPNLGTFRHERGPSLLLLKSAYEDLFRECSHAPGAGSGSGGGAKTAADHGLVMEQCVPAYQVVFDDGDRIDLGFPRHVVSSSASSSSSASVASASEAAREAESISRAKMDTYEPNGSTKWDEYMTTTSAYLDCGLPNFIEERFDLPTFPAFLRESLRDFGKAWPLKPHSDVLDATFESDKMRALASFQDLYVGLEPYRNDGAVFGGVWGKTAPAVFGLLAALELHPTNDNAGVFAPVGGFRAVATALESLCKECGVDIRCDATVSKVTERGAYISSSRGETEFVDADVVVINADLPFATKTLLEPPSPAVAQPLQEPAPTPPLRYDWDDRFEYSSGVVAFHWSTDERYDDLNTHNVFLAASSRATAVESWGVLRTNRVNDDIEGAPFNFYVHRAVATDPTAAPEWCDSIMVLVPCGTLSRKEEFANLPRDEAIAKYKEQFDDAHLARIKDEVLRRMAAVDGLKDLRDHIVGEVIDTPGTYADYYNLAAGTPFALSHGFGQLSLTRPAPQSSVENVFFVGASTRPGNGVPLVLLGAKAIAEKVARTLSKNR